MIGKLALVLVTLTAVCFDLYKAQISIEVNTDYVTTNDIGYKYVTSVADCCYRCNLEPTCVAWTHVNVITYQVCWLKSSVLKKSVAPQRTSGLRQAICSGTSVVTLPTTTSLPISILSNATCSLETGFNYPTNDIGGFYASNPSKCCESCGANLACGAWVYKVLDTPYNGYTGYCFLKSTLATAYRAADSKYYSGSILTRN